MGLAKGVFVNQKINYFHQNMKDGDSLDSICLFFNGYCNVSVKTSNWITENFKCPSPMVSKPKTPSVADFLSYFIIDGYAKKLGTCFVPVNVHVNQYSDRI